MEPIPYHFPTRTAEGFEAIYDLGHQCGERAFQESMVSDGGTLIIHQSSLDAAALHAATHYRETQQAVVPNFTDDDQLFDRHFAAGYVVAFHAEHDASLSDPEDYRKTHAPQLPSARIVDANPNDEC